jgi:hypothetical protein
MNYQPIKALGFDLTRLTNVVFIIALCALPIAPQDAGTFAVTEISNALFTQDPYWQGGDGAGSVDLENGRILWLFSDSFVDVEGSGKRSNARMIRNSVGLQSGYDLQTASMSFYHGGNARLARAFFEVPGETWFWPGHGILVKDKLVVFLIEEMGISEGLGFAAIGWYVAIIDNPTAAPDAWRIGYRKGTDTFGVIVGSAAVLKDSNYVYAFGVKEPSTHETYLFRFSSDRLAQGNIDDCEWWVGDHWTKTVAAEPKSASLFISQTEFSVHYYAPLRKYLQIQTFGFGHAEIGYRLADRLQGPWSDPVIVYRPVANDHQEFFYSANAHPELNGRGVIVTYNANHFDFRHLLKNENLYFPRFLQMIWQPAARDSADAHIKAF